MQFVGPKKLAPLFCLTLKFLACLAYHSRGRAKPHLTSFPQGVAASARVRTRGPAASARVRPPGRHITALDASAGCW